VKEVCAVDEPIESSDQTMKEAQAEESAAKAASPFRDLTWDEWVDLRQFADENRANFPVQQLLPYRGQCIAWEPDGSAIREAADTFGEAWDKIKAQGGDPQIYTYEVIPIP
jgi:hypothetical protein